MKIGIFDSGIGGLSVLNQAMKQLPKEEFLFYGDTKHVPYGEKTEEEVLAYVDEAAAFLEQKGADAIVLACNTATSVAGEALRKKYKIPIIGMEPAAKKALDLNGEKRVLVVATPITVRGEKMQHLIGKIDRKHLVDLRPLPKLVRFAEKGNFDGREVFSYLNEELKSYCWEDYSSLVLGCTHFNYFKDSFRKLLPNTVWLIDGNEGTVNQLQRKLNQSPNAKKHGMERKGASVSFYYSGQPVTEKKELEKINGLLRRLDEMYAIR